MAIIQFSQQKTYRGSNQISIDVARNGRPFGQIWTFRKTATETFPWTAKTLAGEFKHFYKVDGGLRAAKKWIEAKGV